MKSLSNNIKLIVFDVGKTLFDKDKQKMVSLNTKQMLKELKSKGIKVGVCTMRTKKYVTTLFDVDFDFYITLNGAYVECDNKPIINLKIKNDINDSCILTYGKKETYYSNEKANKLAKKHGFIARKKGILKYPYVITLFNKEEPGIKYFKKKYSVSYWGNTKTLTLQNFNCSKANALRRVLKMYSINEEEFLFFGDAPNDLEIFKTFKNTIMVANGYPLLKKYSYDICGECISDGVYYYLLKEKIL